MLLILLMCYQGSTKLLINEFHKVLSPREQSCTDCERFMMQAATWPGSCTGFAFPWAVDHMSELEAMFESEFDYALERDALKHLFSVQ